jgi:ribose 5-phosphate isomerase B
MKIAIGSDEAGYNLKDTIIHYLRENGLETEDYGVYDTNPVLYPDIALKLAIGIRDGLHKRGILICGTGIGMAITANKVPGVRAAVCHDVYSAERSRKSNNCQVMCLGARIVADELAKLLVQRWLECDFQGGGSTAKVDRICQIEEQFSR